MSAEVEAVRELRALTGCGLKVALDHVRGGWKIGDVVNPDLIRVRDEQQAAKYRLERAAPDLLGALKEAQDFIRSYFGPVASDTPEAWSDEDARQVETMASAAIAKALGQPEPSALTHGEELKGGDHHE